MERLLAYRSKGASRLFQASEGLPVHVALREQTVGLQTRRFFQLLELYSDKKLLPRAVRLLSYTEALHSDRSLADIDVVTGIRTCCVVAGAGQIPGCRDTAEIDRHMADSAEAV